MARADPSRVEGMGSAGGARQVPPRAARALADGRSLTRDLAADLLTHLPELGSAKAQRHLDTWVEQAAETLLALSEVLEERLLDLGSTVDTGGRPVVHR